MPAIRLNTGEWTYDEDARLGPPGGFGEVLKGAGASGPVAVKRLKLTASQAAHREMKIGEALASRSLSHVVPVLDFGQDAASDGYFLVMPICERSLQDDIEAGVLTIAEAKLVALDILSGLREVGDIVHRDLKPGNVLRLSDAWRLADFGIAKFVEDSTSLQTLRGSLTPAYGAPEQWRGEAPSHATDVYALGCMFHTMLNGSPPFSGSQDEIRDAHLHTAAPPLGGDPRLAAIVGHMLRKTPEARPSIDRCMEVIESVEAVRARPAHAGLLAAADRVSQEIAAAEAIAQAAATATRQRAALVQEASADLTGLIQQLWGDISDASADARTSKRMISLGRGTMTVSEVTATAPNGQARAEYGSTISWDVVAGATLSVTRAGVQRDTHTSYGGQVFYAGRRAADEQDYKWSATLFFGKSDKSPEYRWREAGFWSFASSHDQQDVPFALDPENRDFLLAFSNVMGGTELAYGPLAIDGENADDFVHRWLTLFTKAVEGTLNRPMGMPVSDRFWQT